MKPILILPLSAALSLVTVGAQSAPASGYLRVVNAATTTTPVDVYVDGQRLSSNIAFASASDFSLVSPTRHTVKITRVGQPENLLLTAQLLPADGKYYTLALTRGARGMKSLVFIAQNIAPGAMTNVETPEKPEPAVEAAKEERAEIVARALKAKLTVYHLAPNAPRVDVFAPGLKPLIAQLSFGQVQVARRKAIKMTLKTAISGAATAPIASSATLRAGQSYSVFIFPASTPNGFQVKVLETRVAAQRR